MFAQTEQLRPSNLARLGFIHEEISSLNNFKKQIESYSLHVIEDRPVSNAYSYFIDNATIYIDERKETPLFVDPQERGGLALLGTRDTINQALSRPGQIVFWYSPPGPVAFETGTRYDKVKPYTDGQLYLLVGKNHHQVDAMAISVAKENEKKVLTTFLGEEKMRYSGFDDEIAKIKYFLTNSIPTDWNIDNFLTYLEDISYFEDFSVYKNVHGQEFNLSEIIFDLKEGWLGKIRPKIVTDNQTLLNILKKGGHADDAYIMQLGNYFSIYAKNGKMPLGGSCGGIEVDQSDFARWVSPKINPLSTNYRFPTPSIQDILKKKDEKDSDEYGSLKFQCPVCRGEHIRPRHELLIKCPTKGKEIPKC